MSTVQPAAVTLVRPSATNDNPIDAMTLADCVPWLEIALDFIDGGPSGLTIEAIERYRLNLMEILEHIRTTVAREATARRTH